MDIHKPKPVHSWREFLSEIAVVVVGISIALGAEQAIEWLHWRHEVEVERHSLLAEAQDALDVIVDRQVMQGCVDARLNEVHVLLQRHAHQQPLKIVAPIKEHFRDSASLGTWQIALTGQALTHMSHDERLNFSSAFTTYQAWDDATKREVAAWAAMAPLQEPDLLSEEDWSRLRSAYWDADQVNRRLQRFGTFVLKAKNLGLHPKATDENIPGFADANAVMCRPFVDLR